MAKVKIQGHASGSGILTVTAPNTSTDRTITLPDATGTLLITAPVTALNNATANELVTVGSTTTELDAESGLTYDAPYLKSSAGSSGVTPHSSARIIIEDDTHCGLEIATGNTHEQYILFSDPQGQSGEIKYAHASDLMQFNTAGSMKFVKGGTLHMVIDANGNIMVGKPTYAQLGTAGVEMRVGGRFDVTRDGDACINLNRLSSDGDIITFHRQSADIGSINVTTSSTAYTTSSDYRLKENIVDMTNAITRLKTLQPRRFNFIVDADKTLDGFVAHEVSTIVPEAITGIKDGMKLEEYTVTPAVLDDDGEVVTEAVIGEREVIDPQGIDQGKLVPLLVGALQEAVAKIEELTTRIETLENA